MKKEISYKSYTISSAPNKLANGKFGMHGYVIISNGNSRGETLIPPDEKFYASEDEAHQACFQRGKDMIDGNISNVVK